MSSKYSFQAQKWLWFCFTIDTCLPALAVTKLHTWIDNQDSWPEGSIVSTWARGLGSKMNLGQQSDSFSLPDTALCLMMQTCSNWFAPRDFNSWRRNTCIAKYLEKMLHLYVHMPPTHCQTLHSRKSQKLPFKWLKNATLPKARVWQPCLQTRCWEKSP